MASPPGSRGARVLVIDDDTQVRSVLERIVTNIGHVAEGVGTRAAAEARLAVGDIDVALCDLRLGEADGLELVRLITGIHAETAAVAVTAVEDPSVIAAALDAGATGYVTKPFKQSDIVVAIEQALRRKDADAARAREHERMEEELRQRADHDPLTGLFNRHRFGEELDRYLRLCSRSGGGGALLMCDLDHFKVVNDSLGHGAGDDVLRRTARLLRDRLRTTDIVARLGGDEFAIVLTGVSEQEALVVAHELRALLADPELRPATSASIGATYFSGNEPLVADDLMIAADAALFEAKERGRNAVVRYSGPRASSLTWIERIRKALDHDELVLYSQPIVDLRTRRVTHEELLIRMVGEDGLVPPGAFLPTAERFGFMEEIDAWTLARALDLAAIGRSVNVNISAQTLQDGRMLETIEARVRAGLDASLLTIEITETSAISNIELVRQLADRLSKLGCGLALDDFGTGFGTFTYLKHLPIDYIKIDREFVRDLAHSKQDQQMIKAMVEIARAAGQQTVAEGVEDVIALDLLRRFGVDYAQGYYLAEPSPVDVCAAPELMPGAAKLFRSLSVATGELKIPETE
jgi:diguanylate cyclase (GGDEF)-like protein